MLFRSFAVLAEGGASRAGVDESHDVADIATLRGTCCAWYTDDGVVPVTDETREAVVNAARALKDAGCEVFEERPPGVERGTSLWLALFSEHAREFVRGVYEGREEDAGRAARQLLQRGSSVKADTITYLDWAASTPKADLCTARGGQLMPFRSSGRSRR